MKSYRFTTLFLEIMGVIAIFKKEMSFGMFLLLLSINDGFYHIGEILDKKEGEK